MSGHGRLPGGRSSSRIISADLLEIEQDRPFAFPLSLQRLCRNGGNTMFVILNEVKNLIKSSSYKTEILRLTPQNDIVTQPHRGEGKGEGDIINFFL